MSVTRCEPIFLPPPPSPRWFKYFGRYCWWYLYRHFHAVRVSPANRPDRLPASPSLIYLNHPSWWDPITCLYAARKLLPAREHYGPMEARMLKRYGILRTVGLYPLEPNTRAGVAAFLRTTRGLIQRPKATVWFTAEGKFIDPRTRPVRLAPGVGHLLRGQSTGIVQPMAVEVVFWNERTPELLIRFGEPVDLAKQEPLSATAWTARLEKALEATMDALAADAMRRDPARFDLLLRGQSGVGGIYDLYRRGRAWLDGKPFVAEHGA